MIKDINSFEIKEMNGRLKEIEKLKRTICDKWNYQDFLDGKMNLIQAIDFYMSFNIAKVQLSSKININILMVKYLKNNNVLSDKIIRELITYFSSNSYSIIGNNIFINLFEELCEKFDIEFIYDSYCDIVVDDGVEEEFKFIQSALRYDVTSFIDDYMEEVGEIEEINYSDTIEEIFEDDAIVFCFRNRKISNETLKILENWLPENDGGFTTEVYEKEGNLYLDISDNDICDILNFEFILIFICSLIKEYI